MPGWYVELRQLHTPEIELEMAHIGDPARVLQRRRAIALEALPHLLAGHDMVGAVHLVVLAAKLFQRQVEAHGHDTGVRFDILAMDEMGIVGRHQWDAQLLADPQQLLVDALQLGRVVVQLKL